MKILQFAFSFILSLWLTTSITFFALRLFPMNAIQSQLQGSGLSEEVIAARIASFGLDKPVLEQYLSFLWDLLRADLGISLYTGQSVNEILASALPNTVNLASLALIMMIIWGITLGICAGLKIRFISWLARRIIDFALAIPIYITATILLFLLAVQIGGVRDNVIFPALILAFHASAAIARLIATRLEELETAPFIQTARAKGLSESVITRRHLLKLAFLPSIPVIASQAAFLFSGTVITESIFGRAGLGILLVDAVLERNYPLVQGIVLLAVTFYLLANTLADILLYWLDPRLREQQA